MSRRAPLAALMALSGISAALLLLLPVPYNGYILWAWAIGAVVLGSRKAIPRGIRRPALPALPAALRLRFARTLALTAGSALLVSGWLFRAGGSTYGTGIEMMLLGGLLLGGALTLHPSCETYPRPANIPLAGGRPNPVLTGLGVLLLLALAEINGRFLNIAWLDDYATIHAQMALLVGGILLLAGGLGGAHIVPIIRSWKAGTPIQRREVGIMVALIAAALTLRLWQLDGRVRSDVDELQFMRAVSSMEFQPTMPILTPIVPVYTPYTYVYSYTQMLSVGLFGHTFFAARFPGAAAGALGVAALYLLARVLYDRKTALLAAVILMTFPPHIHFSRVAMTHTFDPLFGTLALAALAGALRANRTAYFALAGACLGLTAYFYEGGRLLFPALFVLWGGWAMLMWRRNRLRGLALALAGALIIMLPVYLTLVGRGLPLLGRMDDTFGLTDVLAGGAGAYLAYFAAPFQAFVHSPETVYVFMYYGGSQPFILWFIVPFFLLGLGYALWHLWQPAMALPVLWVLGTLAGLTLVTKNLTAPRFMTLFPCMALLIAIGLRYGLAYLWPRRAWALAVGLTAIFAVAQVGYYFGDHLPRFERDFVAIRPDRDITDAALRIAALPPRTQAHLIISDAPPIVAYHRDHVRDLTFFLTDSINQADAMPAPEFTQAYLDQLPRSQPQAFFVEPENRAAIQLIQRNFATLAPQPSPYAIAPEEQFILYFAPARGVYP
jgi:4-amino-4-deoxy-L-arabinose transferase-like glycosyltransferase